MRLVGPASEVSGLRLTKEIDLAPDGVVTHRTTAVNTRESAVSWDLWSNTRMEGTDVCYVPLKANGALKIEFATGTPLEAVATPYEVVDGYFTFSVREFFERRAPNCVAKAFIDPRAGLIVGFTRTDALVKRAAYRAPALMHRDQAFVEIYQNVIAARLEESLLELEMHSEYRTLQPGESMSFEETWQVLRYDGPDDHASHVAFIEQNVER